MLVEVGHGRHEPAFSGLLEINFRRIGVHDRGELVAGLQIFAFRWFRTVGIRSKACHGVTTTGILIQPLGGVQPIL